MNVKGNNWLSFSDKYREIANATMSRYDIPLSDIDVVWGDRELTIFHHGLQHAVRIKNEKNIEGDGLRVDTSIYPITQKALMHLASFVGLSGEALSEPSFERSAFLSKCLSVATDTISLQGQKGIITTVNKKKGNGTCPNILRVISEALPITDTPVGKGFTAKKVKAWEITDDFYRVAVEYRCLGTLPVTNGTIIPYCIVMDSDSGESALRVSFGLKYELDGAEGFFPIRTESWRHSNSKVSITDVYAVLLQDVFQSVYGVKSQLAAISSASPIDIEFSSELITLLGKKRLKSLNISADTLGDQIAQLVCAVCESVKDCEIKTKNAVLTALGDQVKGMLL